MFYIIEQGARIHTSLDSLLQSNTVTPVAASAKVQSVSAEQQQLKNDRGASEAYQQPAPEKPRSQVVFAHQIMSSPVTIAPEDTTLTEVWAMFARMKFHHLPLTNANMQLKGIISDRDLLRFAANNNREIGSHSIGAIMNQRVISAAPETEVRVIAEVMYHQSIGAVPITEDNMEVVGIVSRSDILRVLMNRAPLDLWT